MVNDNDGAQAPEVVEVDQIDSAQDPDNASVDTNGDIVRYQDDKANKVFIKKGSSVHTDYLASQKAVLDAKAAEEAAAAGKPVDDKVQDPDKTDDPAAVKGDGVADDEDVYYNQAHYILKASGFEQEEIEVDGNVVNIKDLTPDQQLDIMVDEFDAREAAYQDRISKLTSAQKEYAFKDQTHKDVLDFLEKGGSPQDLAKHILSNDPKARATMLSDDEVVKSSLEKQGYSKEDAEAEFREMTPGQRERRAKIARTQMEKEPVTLAPLTEELKRAQDAEELRLRKEFETEVTGLTSKINDLQSIGGIVINDKVKNHLKDQTVPAGHNKNSKFVEEILSKPELLAELNFWHTYGAKLVKQAEENGIKKATDKFRAGNDKLDDAPRRSYKTTQAFVAEEQKQKTVTDMDDKEFGKFLNTDVF